MKANIIINACVKVGTGGCCKKTTLFSDVKYFFPRILYMKTLIQKVHSRSSSSLSPYLYKIWHKNKYQFLICGKFLRY